MTWEVLAQLLAEADPAGLLTTEDPTGQLEALEERARAQPAERRWDALLLALQDAVRAASETPMDPCPHVLGPVLRWDRLSVTRLAHEAEAGTPVLVRHLRAACAADPLSRRLLRRQTEGLLDQVPGLERRGDWCAAPLPGQALADQRGAPSPLLGRLLGTGLRELGRWQARECTPLYTPSQWRETPEGLVLVSLEERSARGMQYDIRLLANTLGGTPTPDEDDAVEDLRHALSQAPPSSAIDAIGLLTEAMAVQLAATRHTLFLRQRTLRESNRLAALGEALERLAKAVPPPTGVGAIGVDMEGRVLTVQSGPHAVAWGPQSDLTPLWTHSNGFDAAKARQFLRARARSPHNPRLHREVGGTPELTDAVGRWVSAALKLRTLRILVRHQLTGNAPA